MSYTTSLTTKNILSTDAAQEIYELAVSYREETENSRKVASAVVESQVQKLL